MNKPKYASVWEAKNENEKLIGEYTPKKILIRILIRINALVDSLFQGIIVAVPFSLAVYFFEIVKVDLGYLNFILKWLLFAISFLLLADIILLAFFDIIHSIRYINQKDSKRLISTELYDTWIKWSPIVLCYDRLSKFNLFFRLRKKLWSKMEE